MNVADIDSRLFLRLVPDALRRAARRLTHAVQGLAQRLFERRLGVSTSGRFYLEEVGLEHAERTFYATSSPIAVGRALKALRPDARDVFVDLGCGKGQALLLAARLPFGRVAGVELVDGLRRTAESNLRKASPHLRVRDVEIATADVLEWPVPAELSVVFMYSPFTGHVFRTTMDRIFASYDHHPRPLRLVYVFPWEHNWLMRTGRVVVEDVRPAWWPTEPWWWRTSWVTVTYRIMGADEPVPGTARLPRRLFRPQRAVERWSGPNDQRFGLKPVPREVLERRGAA